MNDHRNGASDPLMQPMFLRPGMTSRNRVAMAAMTHYSAPEDGSVGEAELAYIERRSSGPGVVFTACVGLPRPPVTDVATRSRGPFEQGLAIVAGLDLQPAFGMPVSLGMCATSAYVPVSRSGIHPPPSAVARATALASCASRVVIAFSSEVYRLRWASS